MTLLRTLLHILSGSPEEVLYYTQGIAYGLAFWAIRCGRHAPWQVYLLSCVVHFALGLLHRWPHG